jgi:hypothetical protein
VQAEAKAAEGLLLEGPRQAERRRRAVAARREAREETSAERGPAEVARGPAEVARGETLAEAPVTGSLAGALAR